MSTSKVFKPDETLLENIPQGCTISSLAWSPDHCPSKLLAAAAWDHTVRLWDIQTITTFTGDAPFALSSDATHTAATEVGSLKSTFSGGIETDRPVLTTAVTAEPFVVFGGCDCAAAIWDLRHDSVFRVAGHALPVSAVKVLEDGPELDGVVWERRNASFPAMPLPTVSSSDEKPTDASGPAGGTAGTPESKDGGDVREDDSKTQGSIGGYGVYSSIVHHNPVAPSVEAEPQQAAPAFGSEKTTSGFKFGGPPTSDASSVAPARQPTAAFGPNSPSGREGKTSTSSASGFGEAPKGGFAAPASMPCKMSTGFGFGGAAADDDEEEQRTRRRELKKAKDDHPKEEHSGVSTSDASSVAPARQPTAAFGPANPFGREGETSTSSASAFGQAPKAIAAPASTSKAPTGFGFGAPSAGSTAPVAFGFGGAGENKTNTAGSGFGEAPKGDATAPPASTPGEKAPATGFGFGGAAAPLASTRGKKTPSLPGDDDDEEDEEEKEGVDKSKVDHQQKEHTEPRHLPFSAEDATAAVQFKTAFDAAQAADKETAARATKSRLLITASWDGTVKFWDLSRVGSAAMFEPVFTWVVGAPVTAIDTALAPQAVFALTSRSIVSLDMRSWQPSEKWEPDSSIVRFQLRGLTVDCPTPSHVAPPGAFGSRRSTPTYSMLVGTIDGRVVAMSLENENDTLRPTWRDKSASTGFGFGSGTQDNRVLTASEVEQMRAIAGTLSADDAPTETPVCVDSADAIMKQVDEVNHRTRNAAQTLFDAIGWVPVIRDAATKTNDRQFKAAGGEVPDRRGEYHAFPINSMALHPRTGNTLLVGSSDGNVCAFNMKSVTISDSFAAAGNAVMRPDLPGSPEVGTPVSCAALDEQGQVYAVAVSPDWACGDRPGVDEQRSNKIILRVVKVSDLP